MSWRSGVHFILFVADQARSRAFYAQVLGAAPRCWGHRAGYCLDRDGHVLALACEEPGS